MNLSDEHFRNGQASYARGVSLRTIAEEINVLEAEGKEDAGMSLVLGYLDGVVTSIRRAENLFLMRGPDK